MLVRIKNTRNGLKTTTSKTLNAFIWWNDVKKHKTSYSQRKRCRKPKRPLTAKRSKARKGVLRSETVSKTQKASRLRNVFVCKTPFEFDIAFAPVYTLTSVCLTFWSLYTLLSLYSLLATLTAHIFAYMYMHVHPFVGFQRTCTCIPLWDFWPFRRRVKPYGFFIPFRGEWRHLGIFSSFRSDGHLLSFGDHSRHLEHYVCVWPFEYLFIYLFIYSFIHLFT